MKLLWLMFISIPIVAASDSILFQEANRLYTQNNYEQAVQEYQKITAKNSTIWYNIGNSYYKMGDLIRALAFWKRAYQGAPAHERMHINNNIAYVEKKLGIIKPSKTLLSHVEYVVAMIPIAALQVVMLLVWYLFFAMLLFPTAHSGLQARNKWDQKKRYGILGTLLFFNLLFIGLLMIKYSTIERQQAIVLQDAVTLVAGPHAHYQTVGTVKQLDQVIVREIKDQWCKVYHNDLIGWMPIDKLMIL